MDNYLKNYSRKKVLDFAVAIMVLCLIIAFVVQPSKKLQPDKKKCEVYCESILARLNAQNDSLTTSLNDCNKNSLKTFLKGGYYYHEVTGKSDSINIKRLNIDLLFLKNISNRYLNLSIVEPENIILSDIAYASITHEDNFSWSDDRWPQNKYVTISIEKLNSLNSNIIIEFTKPSSKDSLPLGRLKLIVK